MPNNTAKIENNIGEVDFKEAYQVGPGVTLPNQQQGGQGGQSGEDTQPKQDKNLYDDLGLSYDEYKPNDKGWTNTGAGAASALGQDYTWNKDASDQANTQYKADIETQRQQFTQNATQLNTNAVNYQVQADMEQYKNNQDAEKVGWAGGYVLDQNRQMEYLKQSIQAQMYGAMKLQEYGYSSALSAARLSYDLNQKQFAQQYYQQAVSNALQEASLTGTYFSAETKDMMSQLAVAEQEMAKFNTNSEEYKAAAAVKNSIMSWFEANKISQQGVQALEAWSAKQSQELQYSQELWTRYQAAMQTVKEDQSNNASLFVRLDANGNPIFDGTNVQTVDLAHENATDTMNYTVYKKDDNTYAINQNSKNQFYSYLDSLIENCIATYKQSVSTTDEKGNTKYNINKEKLVQMINEILKNSFTDYKNAADKTEDEDLKTILKQVLSEYKYTFSDANLVGSKDITFGNLQISADDINTSGTSSGVETYTFDDYKNNGYIGTTKYTVIQYSKIDQTKDTDDDFDIDFGKGIGDGTKNYNYDLDVDWSYNKNAIGQSLYEWSTSGLGLGIRIALGALTGGASEIAYNEIGGMTGGMNSNTFAKEQWEKLQDEFNKKYPQAPNGTMVIAGESLWICINGKWGYVQQNIGGKKLYEDLKLFQENGTTPDRWKK